MEVEIGKKLIARVPVVMSLAALMAVAMQLVIFGIKPGTDEGALAHIWQLLMVAQLPLIALFAYQWAGRAPRQALTILFVQLLALVTAALPVFLLGL